MNCNTVKTVLFITGLSGNIGKVAICQR